MAGTTVVSSVPEDEPPVDGVELLPDDDAGAAEAATEARAREMGWKPLAEYRGPPGRWQPAADFIARGENILPIVRDANRRLTEKVGKLEGEMSGMRSTVDEQLKIIKDLRDMGQRADQRGYDRAMAELKTKQRQARANGDVEAFAQLVEQAEALASSHTAAAVVAEPAARPQAPRPPQATVAVQEFIRDNRWFNTDKLLADTMTSFHNEVLQERQIEQATLDADPDLDREILEEAKGRVMDRYPERFGAAPAPREPAPPPAARRRAPAVIPPTNGNEPPAPRPGAVAATIASIADPAERTQARDAFNRMRRQLPDYTEAEYMALYSDPHADVLTMQRQPRRQPNGR